MAARESTSSRAAGGGGMGCSDGSSRGGVRVWREWMMPNPSTFQIASIRGLLDHYLPRSCASEMLVVDPFCGLRGNDYATPEWTNDLNPQAASAHHMDAVEFLLLCERQCVRADAVLLDPPYSAKQIEVCYRGVGMDASATPEDSMNLYEACKDVIARLVKPGGLVFTFGWNAHGFGPDRGFETESILLVAHGGAHNDTITTVERKRMPQHDGETEKACASILATIDRPFISPKKQPECSIYATLRASCDWSPHTFSIPAVAQLLSEIIPPDKRNHWVIVDPFAGRSDWGHPLHRNDVDPETPQINHKPAVSFLDDLIAANVVADVVLMDPPPTPAAVSLAYNTWGTTTSNQPKLYRECRDKMTRLLRPGGLAVSIGYNSMGLGLNRGMVMTHCVLVRHHPPHNDTIIVVERKDSGGGEVKKQRGRQQKRKVAVERKQEAEDDDSDAESSKKLKRLPVLHCSLDDKDAGELQKIKKRLQAQLRFMKNKTKDLSNRVVIRERSGIAEGWLTRQQAAEVRLQCMDPARRPSERALWPETAERLLLGE